MDIGHFTGMKPLRMREGQSSPLVEFSCSYQRRLHHFERIKYGTSYLRVEVTLYDEQFQEVLPIEALHASDPVQIWTTRSKFIRMSDAIHASLCLTKRLRARIDFPT